MDLSNDDRAYLEKIVAQRSGTSESDAKARIDLMLSDASKIYPRPGRDRQSNRRQVHTEPSWSAMAGDDMGTSDVSHASDAVPSSASSIH
jgi:hypothetical protein